MIRKEIFYVFMIFATMMNTLMILFNASFELLWKFNLIYFSFTYVAGVIATQSEKGNL